MNRRLEALRRRTTLSPIEGITRTGDTLPESTLETIRMAKQEARDAVAAIGLREGEILKEEGQAAATAAALPWHEQGLSWIASRPSLSMLTADDVIEAIGLPTGYIHTNWNNSVGALFTAARRLKLIRNTGNYVKSTCKSNHAAVIAVWHRTFEGGR